MFLAHVVLLNDLSMLELRKVRDFNWRIRWRKVKVGGIAE